MPRTAPLAPRIAPSHRANRTACVVDMANFLVTQTAVRWPEASYTEAVEHALAFACELTDPQWEELGKRSGHYRADDADPAGATCSAVLAQLEAMLPVSVEDDAFAGIGF